MPKPNEEQKEFAQNLMDAIDRLTDIEPMGTQLYLADMIANRDELFTHQLRVLEGQYTAQANELLAWHRRAKKLEKAIGDIFARCKELREDKHLQQGDVDDVPYVCDQIQGIIEDIDTP